MPELPEVETVCRGLNQLTLGQTIGGAEVLLRRTLAPPFSITDFCQGINGSKILNWSRRGKYLLAELDSCASLGVHLRMTGQLLWIEDRLPISKHTRIRVFFPKGYELRFVDTRTFGRFWWIPPGHDIQDIVTGLGKLGPEPFSAEFSPGYLFSKLKNRQCGIKTLLLKQQIVAGIGNIYADEALYKSGIRPQAIASELNIKQVELLHQAIIDILQTAIEQGGTTFSDFLGVTGVNGNYGGIAWVYGRKGLPCRRCGTLIEKIILAGRSSHFCPSCQA